VWCFDDGEWFESGVTIPDTSSGRADDGTSLFIMGF